MLGAVDKAGVIGSTIDKQSGANLCIGQEQAHFCAVCALRQLYRVTHKFCHNFPPLLFANQ